MTGWVAIQRNPTSGSGRSRGVLLDLVRRLKEHGIRPRLFSRRERLAEVLADPKRRDELLCVVAAGGDGTVDDVINRYPGLPMTVCPLGTENLFAKYLGLPRDGRAVADAIAARMTRRFDLCTLNGGRRFAIMASFGFDADVVRRTHSRRRGHISKLSYLRPILESFARYRYPSLRLYVDDAAEPLAGGLAIVSNLPMYAMRLPFARSAVPDDGLLDVRVFERPGRWQLLRYAWSLVRNRHERLPHVRSFRARSIRVETDEPVPVQADGDPAGFTPVEIRVLPAELTVIAP
jgi:YegS/Rv2252/BmrU family lipid kinase